MQRLNYIFDFSCLCVLNVKNLYKYALFLDFDAIKMTLYF